MSGSAFRKTLATAVVVAVAALGALTTSPAHADLTQANDPAFGAGTDGFNLTRDTATNLEWLDLTLTTGLSYNAVAGGAGGFIAAGFSFATVSQVSTLFTNAGFTFQDGVNHTVDASSAVLLLNLLGCTVNCTTFAFPAGQGFVDFDVFSSTTAPLALYQAIVSTPGDFSTAFTGRAFAQSVTTFSKNLISSSAGSFLFRPVVISSFLGCGSERGRLIVVLKQGPDIPAEVKFGDGCAVALNSFPETCEFGTETQSADQGFATLYRITCP